MKAIHVFIRANCAAFLLLAMLFAGVPGHVGASSGSPSLAGHWVAHLFWRADGKNCLGDPVCPLVQHAPGPVTLMGNFDIVVSAADKITFPYDKTTFTYEVTVAGAGSGLSRQCNANLWASTAFTGLCPMTGHGTGYVDPSARTPQFHWLDEWVTFHGTKLVREVHNPAYGGAVSSASWPISAQPGYYHDYLPWLGPVPTGSGYHVEEVVARY